MNPQIQLILNYLGHGLLLTLQQLLIVLGPLLVIAFVLHNLSKYSRNRMAWRFGSDIYAYVTAIGVAVHELGHAFFCVIFGHKILKMKLFQLGEDGSLGYVKHAYNPRSTYQRIGNFFIATGPIWFGTAIVYLLSIWLTDSKITTAASLPSSAPGSGSTMILLSEVTKSAWGLLVHLLQPALLRKWQFWVFAYLVFCIGSHIKLSRSDLRGAWRGFVSLVVALVVFNLLTLWLGDGISTWACDHMVQWCVVFYSAALFVIFINLAVALLVFICL